MLNRAALALIHFVPAVMLIFAIGHWPYGYYILLRIIVTGAALLLAALAHQRIREFTIWSGLLLAAALVFNPLVPLHSTRGLWWVLDLSVAGLFIAHYVIARFQLIKT